MTEDTSGAGNGAAFTAHVGDDVVTLQRPNQAKISRVFAELRAAGGATEAITTAYGDFVRAFEATNVVELDRVQARMQYPARPIIDPDTRAPVLDEHGDPIMAPSIVDRMTEADWQASGGRLRLPRSPSIEQAIGHVAPIALELAEDRVYRVLALFLMDNGDVARLRKAGTLDEELERRVDDLLERAYADELLELAVVAGEVVDHHFRRKIGDLGERMGNALRLIGLGPRKAMSPETATTSTTSSSSSAGPSSSPETSTPTSSTDSPASTDGAPTPSSTPPPTSSSPSAPASSETQPSASSSSSSDEATSSPLEEAPAPA